MKTGALHLLPVLQLMTPEPNSPPMMNAAFFIDGITTTHSALFQIRSWIPLSEALRISVRRAVDWLSRLASSFDGTPNAVVPTSRQAAPTTSVLRLCMAPSLREESAIHSPARCTGLLAAARHEMLLVRDDGWGLRTRGSGPPRARAATPCRPRHRREWRLPSRRRCSRRDFAA